MRMDSDALKIIVNDRPLVRLLTIISQQDGCRNRKLLKRPDSNEFHPLLVKAESEGVYSAGGVKARRQGQLHGMQLSYREGQSSR